MPETHLRSIGHVKRKIIDALIRKADEWKKFIHKEVGEGQENLVGNFQA